MGQSRIETAGRADEVLAMAAAGKSAREIAAHLAKRGVRVSYSTVGRFLRREAAAREASRRAVGQERAAAVAAQVDPHLTSAIEHANKALEELRAMALDGYMVVRLPDEDPTHVPLEARDRVAALKQLQSLVSFLAELAGAVPDETSERSLADIRAHISQIFGYGFGADSDDPQEAPPTDQEHQPPVIPS